MMMMTENDQKLEKEKESKILLKIYELLTTKKIEKIHELISETINTNEHNDKVK